jgi:hypothetical protein
MAAFPNPFRGLTQRWKRGNGASNVVPIRGDGTTAIPVQQDGQKLTPHEFLEAQIINLPAEEESAQKRVLLAIAYFAATWGGSAIMILLGIGLALDLQGVFHVTGMFAIALTLLFPFAEFIFEMLAILVGERIHGGLKTSGDWAFVLVFTPFILFINTSTAMLQVFLIGWNNATVASTASLILWARAFLPLLVIIGTIGVVAGIQRRSLPRMINALDRKSLALTRVAEASVRYLEAQMNAQRAMDEHEDSRRERERKDAAFNTLQEMMKASFDRDMEDIRKIRETQASRQLDNGRNGRF